MSEEEVKSMVIRPAMELKDAKTMFEQFESIKTKILGSQDTSKISGKTFVNKTGWRKIKTMFGLSEEILNSRREKEEDGAIRWIYRVRVKHDWTGIYADAEACCDTKEPFAFLNKQTGQLKPENMIMAMAQSRAFNRAISDLVGGGELEDDSEQNGLNNVPIPNVCAACNAKITDAEKKYSIDKYKKTLCRKCQEIINQDQAK